MKTLTQLKHKILLNESEATLVVKERQKEGKKVVFTNGCFDILHRGHVEYLAKAADCGDVLMIAVNTDASVKAQNKGVERPINQQMDRMELLAGLFFVDYVVLFDEETPLNLIEKVQPDVLVKGADYNPNQIDKTAKDYIVGRDVVLAKKGEVKVISLVQGYSTTNIVEKLRQ